MASLCQANDKVCLDLGTEKREVLFSILIAEWAADALEMYAKKAILSHLRGYEDREPSVDVDVVLSSGKPQVRLRFGWWTRRAFFTPAHALGLARWLRLACEKANDLLRWEEHGWPLQVLS